MAVRSITPSTQQNFRATVTESIEDAVFGELMKKLSLLSLAAPSLMKILSSTA